jgi:hypothetical protein
LCPAVADDETRIFMVFDGPRQVPKVFSSISLTADSGLIAYKIRHAREVQIIPRRQVRSHTRIRPDRRWHFRGHYTVVDGIGTKLATKFTSISSQVK